MSASSLERVEVELDRGRRGPDDLGAAVLLGRWDTEPQVGAERPGDLP